MNTLHCVLENGADLYVNERKNIQHYRARSSLKKEEEERRRKKKKECQITIFFTSRSAYVKLRYVVMLYTHLIGNQP